MEENIKLKNSNSKIRERRLSNPPTENPPKRNAKMPGFTKSDLSKLMAPQNFDVNSSVKKIFNEANKIVKIGMEKEFALQEKNNTLQNSNEIIDNLRKNILHLQMEYEKLDQNYQREISTRGEIVKRMDATRDIVESMVQYSNTLASSIKLLEDDKCKIVEYYELIFQGQKEIEAKHTDAKKLINELDYLFKSKIEDLKNSYEKALSQNSEKISQLSRNLSYVGDKLKISGDENEKLQTKIKEFQEISRELEESLQKQKNFNNKNQEVISKLIFKVKKLRNQKFRNQKLLKNKMKKIRSLLTSNNIKEKDLKNVEELLQKYISANKVLESNNFEWETKFEKQLQEEALQNQDWEARVTQLSEKIKLFEKEYEELKVENNNLNEKLSELAKNEIEKQKEIEDLQNDLSKMLSSKLNLQEDLKKLNDESMHKEKKISDLEINIADFKSKFNADTTLYQCEIEKLQELVKKLESQLSEAEKQLSLEKNQKEIVLSECDSKLENLKIANEKINNLEKLLETKEAYIKEIEFQQTTLTLDGNKSLEKLNKDLKSQKIKNKELTTGLKNLENNYSAVKAELQEAKNKILDFEEKVNEEKLLNRELKDAKNELEKNAVLLKKEIESEKCSIQELQEKHRKAEEELTELKKTAEENVSLKSTVIDLKNVLKATEARVEAYKVVVKKLETEKAEVKCSQVEEALKQKLSGQEEATKKIIEFSKGRTSERTTHQTENTSQLQENTPLKTDTEKWHLAPSTPVKDSKTFLTSKRTILTSTPQSAFRNLTPFKKKRDPYEFDSDSSVERFDTEQVLKVFNRQKKDTNKKSRTSK